MCAVSLGQQSKGEQFYLRIFQQPQVCKTRCLHFYFRQCCECCKFFPIWITTALEGNTLLSFYRREKNQKLKVVKLSICLASYFVAQKCKPWQTGFQTRLITQLEAGKQSSCWCELKVFWQVWDFYKYPGLTQFHPGGRNPVTHSFLSSLQLSTKFLHCFS